MNDRFPNHKAIAHIPLKYFQLCADQSFFLHRERGCIARMFWGRHGRYDKADKSHHRL